MADTIAFFLSEKNMRFTTGGRCYGAAHRDEACGSDVFVVADQFSRRGMRLLLSEAPTRSAALFVKRAHAKQWTLVGRGVVDEKFRVTVRDAVNETVPPSGPGPHRPGTCHLKRDALTHAGLERSKGSLFHCAVLCRAVDA